MTTGEVRTGWRPAPPDEAALVRWPEAFGTRFTIIVDTEEEFDWHEPLARAGHGTATVGALPIAARRFADHGCALAYAVDHPIATAPAAIDALQEVIADGRSSVGAQLHAWVNPPYDEALTPANSFAGNLPRALEAAKLDVLTQAIERGFGRRPILYRAGRYGIGPNTLHLLAERGYAIDSSMRSGYAYIADAGPDFSGIGNAAFRAGPGGAVVELPFSTVFTGRLRSRGAMLHALAGRLPKGRGVLARAGLMSRVSLTPEDMPVADALEAVRVALGEGLRLLNFAFHSPSLVPGYTPYVRDASDLAAFWRWWDAVLGLLAQRSVAFATIDDILAACGPHAAPVSGTRAVGL
jgi:hypothetical protein